MIPPLEVNHSTLGMTHNYMYLTLIEKETLSFTSTHPTANNSEKIVSCVKSRLCFLPAKEQEQFYKGICHIRCWYLKKRLDFLKCQKWITRLEKVKAGNVWSAVFSWGIHKWTANNTKANFFLGSPDLLCFLQCQPGHLHVHFWYSCLASGICFSPWKSITLLAWSPSRIFCLNCQQVLPRQTIYLPWNTVRIAFFSVLKIRPNYRLNYLTLNYNNVN